MDLRTVRKNFAKGSYKCYNDFFKDLLLIFSNCKAYNEPTSEIHKAAAILERNTKRLIRGFKKDSGMIRS